jgi:hypothetical protein
MTRRQDPELDPAGAETLAAAMRAMGWLVPDEAEAVAAAEADLPEAIPWPDELPSFETLASAAPPADGLRAAALPAGPNADVHASLARAAREAGHLNDAVARRMAADRRRARRNPDDEMEAPDNPTGA